MAVKSGKGGDGGRLIRTIFGEDVDPEPMSAQGCRDLVTSGYVDSVLEECFGRKGKGGKGFDMDSDKDMDPETPFGRGGKCLEIVCVGDIFARSHLCKGNKDGCPKTVLDRDSVSRTRFEEGGVGIEFLCDADISMKTNFGTDGKCGQHPVTLIYEDAHSETGFSKGCKGGNCLEAPIDETVESDVQFGRGGRDITTFIDEVVDSQLRLGMGSHSPGPFDEMDYTSGTKCGLGVKGARSSRIFTTR